MKHILLIHQVFVTPSQGGGTRHYELAKYLVQYGFKVTIIASDTDYLTGKQKKTKTEILDGITILYAPTYKHIHKSIFHRAIAFLSFSFSSFYYGIKTKNVDIIWGTSPPLFQSLTCLLLSIVKRKPFVFEIRDLWIDFSKQLNIVKSPFLYYPCKLIEWILYKCSKKIIVNSPGFIPYISKVVSENKIKLIPNGVITKDFNNINEAVVKKLKTTHIKDNKFHVIYTGNLGIANDIETILDTAILLQNEPQIHFSFVGGGIKLPNFKSFIEKNKLQNVSFLPSISKKEIPELLSLASVCLATLKDIPLFSTVYPNKVFDYMAAEKPTILAIDGAIKDVIKKSEGGIVIKPGSSIELKESIMNYFKNSTLLNLHGKNAKKYVSKHFDRENISKNLIDFFNTQC
jgi:glycosyltransferase involved in cell wall biosynthesis